MFLFVNFPRSLSWDGGLLVLEGWDVLQMFPMLKVASMLYPMMEVAGRCFFRHWSRCGRCFADTCNLGRIDKSWYEREREPL